MIEAQVGSNGLGRADTRDGAPKITAREVAFERRVTRSSVVMRVDGRLFGRQKERGSLGAQRW